MKKVLFFGAVFVLLFALAGCTPKSVIYNDAQSILERVEDACVEIASDVEALGDEYTTGVFERVQAEAENYRAMLDNNPDKTSLKSAVVALGRLEKELGSIKVLTSGIGDYTPELTFEFVNNTGKVVTEISLDSESSETINGFSGELAPGANTTVKYPIEDGTWNVTAVTDNGDKVTGEEVNLSTINALTLNQVEDRYEFTVN